MPSTRPWGQVGRPNRGDPVSPYADGLAERLSCALPTALIASAVGVPRAAATHRPWTTHPRRSSGAANLHLGHGAGSELLGKTPQQLRDQQPNLGCPRGRVSAHREHTLGPSFGFAVRSDVFADDLDPSAHDSAHRHVILPAVLSHQPPYGRGQRLRVAIVGVCSGPRLHASPSPRG